MIGQNNLKENINQLVDNNKFPQSCIICGAFGSGRKEISKYIANKLNKEIVFLESKMAVIEENLAELSPNTIYVLTDFDTANFRVKYKMLKTLEEPMKDVYFILTCENLNNIYLPILSRCQVLYMEQYSEDELLTYAKDNNLNTELLDLCKTPFDVSEVDTYNAEEFNTFVETVYKNISSVQLANALKISNQLSLKKDAKGYSLKIFLIAISKLYFENNRYEEFIITDKHISDLQSSAVNKLMVFDSWLFDIREVEKCKLMI